MSATIKNINITRKSVLVAPLDWGLGHATRCVPIIKELLRQDFSVILAGENAAATLLVKEFPLLQIINLKGYRVSYSKKPTFFLIKMVSQLPKISKAIREEKEWLNKIVTDNNIDIIISDNRFGLYHKDCHSIFITHQLNIKTGNHFTEWLVKKINYRYINNFDECWVPDMEGIQNLAGKLSHPQKMPSIPVRYIGILSRFKKTVSDKSIDVLVILSGPEPQRSIFEIFLLDQLKKIKLKTFFIRGLPGINEKLVSENNAVEIINHLPADDLNDLICSAKTVVARSGYSTVMDLAVLQQRSILIPTPGQTEQEYLAKHLEKNGYCLIASQKELNIEQEFEKLISTDLKVFPEAKDEALRKAIADLK